MRCGAATCPLEGNVAVKSSNSVEMKSLELVKQWFKSQRTCVKWLSPKSDTRVFKPFLPPFIQLMSVTV